MDNDEMLSLKLCDIARCKIHKVDVEHLLKKDTKANVPYQLNGSVTVKQEIDDIDIQNKEILRSKRAKNLNKPNRPETAFTYFMSDFRLEMTGKKPNGLEVSTLEDLGKKRWKDMNGAARQPYVNKESAAKLIYETYLRTNTVPYELDGKRMFKDEAETNESDMSGYKPGYLRFQAQFRKKMAGKFNNRDLMRKGAALWRNMTDDEKQSYGQNKMKKILGGCSWEEESR